MGVLSNPYLPPAVTSNSLGGAVSSAVKSSLQGAVGLSKASTRVNVADVYRYSQRTVGPSPNIIFPDASQDWRVRISLSPNSDYFYNDRNNSLLSPLRSEPGYGSGINSVAAAVASLAPASLTGARRIGVVFPYTPMVAVTHTATYTPQKLVHNNYTQYNYENSEVEAITITAEFTVQSIDEGQYLLAALYFFRSCTKMFFGMDPKAGNPPPICFLNGYGQYYLPNVPIVITKVTHTMPADVDYMDIPEPFVTSSGYNPQITNRRLNSTRMPTTSSLVLTAQPVYSRTSQSGFFSLEDFARGALVNKAGAGYPATSFGASQQPTNGITGNGGFL